MTLLFNRVMSKFAVTVLLLGLTVVLTVPATGETDISAKDRKTEAWVTIGMTPTPSNQEKPDQNENPDEIEDPEKIDPPKGEESEENIQKSKSDTEYGVESGENNSAVKVGCSTMFILLTIGQWL